MNKPIAKSWRFASSSGSKTYETLQYTDGSTSCQCMGWCRQVKPDGSRTCKHTRMVESGMADSECIKSLDMTQKVKPVKVPKFTAPVEEEKVEAPKKASSVARKIQW
jgi:hypothetical protein